jgi:hypothetical protein
MGFAFPFYMVVGIQNKLDNLSSFCDNYYPLDLAMSKIMAFNMSNKEASNTILAYNGQEVETMTSYTYLEVVFSSSSFCLILTTKSRVSRGYAMLTTLESQCL